MFLEALLGGLANAGDTYAQREQLKDKYKYLLQEKQSAQEAQDARDKKKFGQSLAKMMLMASMPKRSKEGNFGDDMIEAIIASQGLDEDSALMLRGFSGGLNKPTAPSGGGGSTQPKQSFIFGPQGSSQTPAAATPPTPSTGGLQIKRKPLMIQR